MDQSMILPAFAVCGLVLIMMIANYIVKLDCKVNEEQAAKNFDDLSKRMQQDKIFSKWADDFGLSYYESAAAWGAYQLGKSVYKNENRQ